jgi:hypothetical protein
MTRSTYFPRMLATVLVMLFLATISLAAPASQKSSDKKAEKVELIDLNSATKTSSWRCLALAKRMPRRSSITALTAGRTT